MKPMQLVHDKGLEKYPGRVNALIGEAFQTAAFSQFSLLCGEKEGGVTKKYH